MENKQIMILVGVIFLSFVGYKIISSSIQENKDKAVLEEKAQLDQLAKAPLNKCIDDINSDAKYNIKKMRDLAWDLNSEPSYSLCMKSTGHGATRDALIASGKINLKDYCTFSFAEQDAEEQKILDKAKIDIQECYKRYK